MVSKRRGIGIGVLALVFLNGCVMHETYGPPALTTNERAKVVGYWHYRLLYDEELYIVSVDGKREGKAPDWPYAYSISLPAGEHRLQLALLRNGNLITQCTMEERFEAGHQYKFTRFDHNQTFLAHPVSPIFPAALSLIMTSPSHQHQHLTLPAVCGESRSSE